jgi:hypothetical protein
MKSVVILVLLCGTLLGSNGVLGQPRKLALNDPSLIRGYQRLITPERLASRLHFFASDFFEGRETTTRGQKLAAHYLASEYHQLGLTPYGTEKSSDPLSPYFQPFTVYKRTPRQSRLEVTSDSKVSATVEPFSALRTENVLAFIEGTDPKLKLEVLIISSHYDHLGINTVATNLTRSITTISPA